MSYEGTLKCIPGAVAGSDLTSKQYLCMVQSGDSWIPATSPGSSAWVLQNDPDTGGEASIAYAGVSKVKVGTTGVRVGFVMNDASGKAVQATAGKYSLGLALASGSSGDIVPVLLFGAWTPDSRK
jgi:hypothetical protein